MNMNIEKAASAYGNNRYFAEMSGMAAGRGAGAAGISVDFRTGIRDSAVSDRTGMNGYDRSMKSGVDGKGSDRTFAADESVQEFLKKAIDTLKGLVTDEDYSQLAELGIIADREDAGTLVTVYERIQIQLAAYGDGTISSLNISGDKIDKILKSPALANEVKRAESIGDIDDGAKEYLLKNDMEPTVENIYMAVHAGDGAETGRVHLSDEEWRQLEPQVTKYLEKNGIEADNEALEGARWLLDKDISLNVDNLIKYMKLKKIENQTSRDSEYIKANMVMAELFGEGAGRAYMTSGWIDTVSAEEAVDAIAGAGEDTIRYITDNELTLNVANIKKYKETEESGSRNEESHTYAHAIKVLAEAKAVMTMEGAVLMEKLGIDITYTDIEELTARIKEEQKTFAEAFLGKVDKVKTSMYMSLMDIMSQMSTLPLATVGTVAATDSFCIQTLYDEGARQRDAYRRAGYTYEAVGTGVRADLGDNIKKAFDNADSLISESGLTPDDTYRRAVRILGYNSMEVTKDSIIMIAEKAAEVDRVIKGITPKTASFLIEHGINPLDEDIEELNDRIELINKELGADENEEYSRYLWKLEKAGSVTAEQRAAYIELYRALKTISGADTRAIGAVINENATLTLGNLLSAEKSRTKQGMDIEVDDKTGYYQGRLVKSKLSDILAHINAGTENTENHVSDFMDRTIDELWQQYNTPENEEMSKRGNNEYMSYIMRENAVHFSETMMYDILDSGVTYTMANMSAASMLISRDSEIKRILKDRLRAGERIQEAFDSEESASEVYDSLDKEAKELYKSELDGGEDYLRYRNLSSVTGYMVNAAKNKCYHIPVELDGGEVMVRVKFAHDENNSAAISISMEDEKLGYIEASMKVEKNAISGCVSCREGDTAEHIRKHLDIFSQSAGMETMLAVTQGDAARADENRRGMDGERHTDRELYDISKSFIAALKVWSEMPINNVD